MRGGSGERDPDLAGGHRETVGGLCPGVSGWILPQEPAKQSSPPARQSWQRKAMASSWMESFWLEAHWTRPFHLTLAFCLALGLLQAIKLYLQRQRLLRDLRLFPSPPTHWLYGHQKVDTSEAGVKEDAGNPIAQRSGCFLLFLPSLACGSRHLHYSMEHPRATATAAATKSLQ